MKIKVKKLHKDAVIPTRALPGDAGLDLTAIGVEVTENYIEYDTGLAFEIPQGLVGLVFARSSISKKAHSIANAVGVIDSGYRGSVKVRMRYEKNRPPSDIYQLKDKVAQLVVAPIWTFELEESNDLSETDRGSDGFGSTGAK